MTFRVLFVLTIKYIPDNSTLPTIAPIIQFCDFSYVSKGFFVTCPLIITFVRKGSEVFRLLGERRQMHYRNDAFSLQE